ncbi:MAG: hypothetical protein IK954_02130 [Clostridia bacterium]|nr:hypothetical protein [Clostridia bacterium]
MKKTLRKSMSVLLAFALLASLALLPSSALPSTSELQTTTGIDTMPRGLFWSIADYFVEQGLFGDLSTIASGKSYAPTISNIDQEAMFGDLPWRGEYLLADDTFGAMNYAFARVQNHATNGYYSDKQAIGVGTSQNLFQEGATTTGTIDNVGTHGSGSFYFNPTANAKVLAYTYVAPYSGTYKITNPNVVTSQQLYKYFTAYGNDAELGFAVVKMGKDDTLASAERLYPASGDFAYIYSKNGGVDSDDDGVNDTAGTTGKVTYPHQDTVFGSGLEVHLEKGEVIRFVYNASDISASYSTATLQFRGGVITLVSKDPTDESMLNTYKAGTTNTSLLSLMNAWETYFVNHSGYDSISPTISGTVATRNLSLADASQEEILASSPWRAEYMNADGILQQMTYISARKYTTYDATTGTESSATFNKRWMGVDSSNVQLLWSEGRPAVAAGGVNSNYHNATFLQPNNNYKVIAWTYTAPVDGNYLVKSPYRTVVAQAVSTNAKYAVVKIVDDQTVASATRVFPTDGSDYTLNDDNGFDQISSAGITVSLKKGEKLAFVVDDTEATAHKWVKVYPDVALVSMTVDGEVQTVFADEFVDVDNPTATAGETVNVKVDAERAKQMQAASLIVTDAKGKRLTVTRKGFREDLFTYDEYTFTMPADGSAYVKQAYVTEDQAINFGILGAQYRQSGGEADGIRFGTQFWCDYDAETGKHTFVDNGVSYTVVSAGTLITRRTILDTLAGRAGATAEAYMTLEALGADETYGKYLRNIRKSDNVYYDVTNEYMEFVGGITGLAQSDYPSGTPYEWVFCGRGYVIAEDAEGNAKTFYTAIYDKSINELMGVA